MHSFYKFRLIMVLALCASFFDTKGQTIQLVMSAHPSPYISDWEIQRQTAIMMITYTGKGNVNAKISTQLYNGKGDLVAETDLSKMPIITIDPGVVQYSAEDIYPLNAIKYHGSYNMDAIVRSGRIPDDNYRICISLVNPTTNAALTTQGPQCAFFNITAYQAPRLITPRNNEFIVRDETRRPVFSWIPVQPGYSGGFLTYRLQVMEVLPGQDPGLAYRRNKPILERDYKSLTNVSWPVDYQLPDIGMTYVWSVQALDDQERPVGDNDGRSGYFVFSCVGNTPSNLPGVILLSPANNAAVTADDLKNPGAFSWTAVQAPVKGGIVTYRLRVLNVQKGQPAAQAFIRNKPILERDFKSLTDASWSSDAVLPDTGLTYAWYVQALDAEGSPIGDNNGWSEPFTFNCIASQADTTVHHSLRSDMTSTATDSLKKGDTILAGNNHEFIIIADTVKTGTTAGKLTGKGKVHIKWMNADVAVEFTDITVNTDKQLTDGSITAVIDPNPPTYPKAWAAQSAANLVMSNGTVSTVIGWVNKAANAAGHSLSYMNTDTYTAPIDMPLGLNFSGDNQYAITEIEFKPDEADINIVTQKAVTIKGSKDTLGFLGTDIKIHPKKIDFSSGTLELVADIPVILNNKVTLTFKKPSTTSDPTDGWFLQWDSTGISNINVEIDAQFSRDWLIPYPDPTGTDKVTAAFIGNATAFSDILITGSMPACQIVNSAGSNSGVVLDGGVNFAIDLSDIRNPDSIKFPASYTDTGVTWQGFSMPLLKINLPSSWKKPNGDTIKVAVDTFLIDHSGVTMHALATNVADFNNASVASLSATIDTVEVMVLANSITEANIKGRVILPVTKDTANVVNPLKYVAIYAQPTGANDYFQITINPTGPIDADLLKGKMTLDATSGIYAHMETGKDSFNLDLNGSFKWDDITLGPIKNVKMDLDFEGVGLSKSPTGGFKFNIGTWGFASPQKFLAHIPVTITEIGFTPILTGLDTSEGELIKGSVNFKIICNLSDDVGGSTKLGVVVGIGKLAGHSYKPLYHDTQIDSIAVHADLSAVSIDGGIGFFHDDPTYGNGFVGGISVVFKAAELKLDALVQFGTTIDHTSNETYRYWRVEALVTLPPPGVVFMSGLAFRGFGGGAYQNMYPALYNGGFTFKPKKGNLGFEAKAVIATTPKDEAFNMDVTLLGNFSSSGGLTYLGFGGQFYVGAGIDDRNQAMVKGGLSVDYDFTTKIFDLSAEATVDAEEGGTKILYTPPGDSVGLVLHIDGSTNKWYFKSGTPTQSNTIDVLGISLYSYLMMGNDLGGDVPKGFTTKFSGPYNSLFPGSLPGLSPSDGGASLTATGKGFALGVGIVFSQTTNDVVYRGTIRTWSVNTSFSVGAELDLALMQYSGSCNGINPVGIRGFRATGGLGFYAAASASIDGIVRASHSPFSDIHCSLANIKGGAWVAGAFPNPVFAQGAIDGDVSALNDLVSFHFHKGFTYGTDCGAMAQDAGPVVVQQDAADSQGRAMIKYIMPSATYYFPDSSPINVAYNLVPGEAFSIGEQQSDGSSKSRTFKMMVTTSLKEGNVNSANPNLTLASKTNNLGEYQYYHPVTIAGASSAFQTSASGLSTGGGLQQSSGNSVGLGSGALGSSSSGGGTWGTTSSGTSIGINSSAGGSWSSSNSGPAVPYPPEPAEGTVAPTPPAPKNSLELDKLYTFTVTATLMELKTVPVLAGQGRGDGGTAAPSTWQPATTLGGAPLVQKIVKTFKTGPQFDNTGTTASSSGAGAPATTSGGSGASAPANRNR